MRVNCREQIANPAEPVNGQDERRKCAAVDSPARLCCSVIKRGLLQKTNLRQALIYIHFHTEDRILAQIVENFSHFGHAYAGSTVLVGPES